MNETRCLRCRPIVRALRRTPCVAFGVAMMFASAGVAAQDGCEFRNTPVGNILFGAPLDPSVAATVSASAQMRVRCPASVTLSWVFSGAHGRAPLRMKHATRNAFIAYSANVTPVNIPNDTNQFWRITATVLGSAYQDAPTGTYSDLLTVTINP